MSLTAKVLTISDFAYLNLFLQWLVPLTIIQTLGLPLVSNIYVGGGEMSVNQYLLISKKILQKILIISIPVFIVTAVNLFGISLDLIVPYLILLLANIVLYFQSQLLQARKLDAMLSNKKQQIDVVLLFNVSNEDVIRRLAGRRFHEKSGRSYHLEFNPPKIEGKDDLTGEFLIQRADDKEKVVQSRLKIYHDQTMK